jgi:hypothetical protein
MSPNIWSGRASPRGCGDRGSERFGASDWMAPCFAESPQRLPSRRRRYPSSRTASMFHGWRRPPIEASSSPIAIVLPGRIASSRFSGEPEETDQFEGVLKQRTCRV